MRPTDPPALATALLERFIPPRTSAGLIGDLIEEHRNGRSRAWYWQQTIRALGTSAFRQARTHKYQATSAIVLGYLSAMPEERFLVIQLHELLTYLGRNQVVSVLVGAHHGLIGAQMQAPVDASYLADAVLLLRYFEARGEVRQAVSVVKKRGGVHERTIREFGMNDGRIRVGETLHDFRGVLTGVPVYEGSSDPLLGADRRKT